MHAARWVVLAATVLTLAPAPVGSAAPKEKVAEAIQLGLKALEKGDADGAIAAFTRAIQLDPKNAKVYLFRGDAYGRKGDYPKALADYNQAAALDPKDPDVFLARGTFFAFVDDPKFRDPAKAEADFTRVIELDPKNVFAYSNRGLLYMDQEPDKAIANFTKALAIDPKAGHLYINRGSAHLNKKDYAKAIADFTRAIDLNPKDFSAYLARAAAYRSQKEYAKARDDLEKAIEADPKFFGTYIDLAWLLATAPDPKVRDGTRAVALAQKAVELTKETEPRALEALAAALAETGQFAEAVTAQKKALATPGIPKEELERAQMRLKLYEAKKPYREE
jgi:tetratricopeptide (TPR) repeat protein